MDETKGGWLNEDIAPKIAARYVMYMIKIEGVWKVRFWETGMIPKNEDMPKLNKALAEEE